MGWSIHLIALQCVTSKFPNRLFVQIFIVQFIVIWQAFQHNQGYVTLKYLKLVLVRDFSFRTFRSQMRFIWYETNANLNGKSQGCNG